MNELDIEVIKENYIQYKKEHHEDEREMRKLLKMKKMVPSIVNDESWKKDYKRLNDNLADGLYYYNELKKMLPEKELKEFADKVKFDVLREKYVKFELDKIEDDLKDELENEDRFEEFLENDQKIIPKVEKFDKSLFAKSVFDETDLIKKAEIICRYQRSSIDVNFDTMAVFKAELARILIEHMNIENLDKDVIITACLVYAFKRTNSPKEIERIKKEKDKDKEFLQSLGFDDRFCKICSEYNRYNENNGYERENEGDILELMDKFVGLIMHREDRLAFSVDDALDLLRNKILQDVDNKYEAKFVQFVKEMESIEVTRDVGVITYFANSVNKNQRHNIASVIETINQIRGILGGAVNEKKVKRLEKLEKIQDKYTIVQTLRKMIEKLKEKVENLAKILKGYKRLSEGTQNKNNDEIFDR